LAGTKLFVLHLLLLLLPQLRRQWRLPQLLLLAPQTARLRVFETSADDGRWLLVMPDSNAAAADHARRDDVTLGSDTPR
jgi:hypothetical protein